MTIENISLSISMKVLGKLKPLDQQSGSVVIDSMLMVTPIVGFCNCYMFCCALLYVHSNFAIILMGKRELVALLCLSSCCLMIVVWLFLTMRQVCLQFVIVVFPDHTQLLFLLPIGLSAALALTPMGIQIF